MTANRDPRRPGEIIRFVFKSDTVHDVTKTSKQHQRKKIERTMTARTTTSRSPRDQNQHSLVRAVLPSIPLDEDLPHDKAAMTQMATTIATAKSHHDLPHPQDNNQNDAPAPATAPPEPQEWDLRIRYGSPHLEAYNRVLKHDDVVVVPEFFGDEDDWTLYHQLLNEIKELQKQGVPGTQWKRCPKAVGKHMACANPMKCATFKEIVTKVCKYFGIRRDKTLEFALNWYKQNDDLQTPRHEEEYVCIV